MKDRTADLYLERFLDVIQEHSIRNLTFNGKPPIDWPSYRADIYSIYKTASSLEDVVYDALKKLDDGHSYLPKNHGSQSPVESTWEKTPSPKGKTLSNVGYIYLPHHNITDYSNLFGEKNITNFRAYAETVQSIIRNLDEENPRGWVVDLRANLGGAYWPMLAGISPLLGYGRHGYFLAANEKYNEEWGCWNGKFPMDLIEKHYTLRKQRPPIAVLTGKDTISSGETICIAFRGLANVKSFGASTGGMSTGNVLLEVEGVSGPQFVLSTSIMADRNKTPYSAGIEPDIFVQSDLSFEQLKNADYLPENDPLVQRAALWVTDQAFKPELHTGQKPYSPSL